MTFGFITSAVPAGLPVVERPIGANNIVPFKRAGGNFSISSVTPADVAELPELADGGLPGISPATPFVPLPKQLSPFSVPGLPPAGF